MNLKAMRSLFCLLFALCVESIAAGADLKGLVGSWSFAYKMQGAVPVTAVGVSVFHSDGTYHSAAVLTAEGPKAEVSIAVASSGEWTLDGKRLTMTIKETNKPELSPVGTVAVAIVEEVTDTYYSYRGEDGVLRQEQRIKDDKTPNQALLPTPTAVTPAASHPSRQP